MKRLVIVLSVSILITSCSMAPKQTSADRTPQQIGEVDVAASAPKGLSVQAIQVSDDRSSSQIKDRVLTCAQMDALSKDERTKVSAEWVLLSLLPPNLIGGAVDSVVGFKFSTLLKILDQAHKNENGPQLVKLYNAYAKKIVKIWNGYDRKFEVALSIDDFKAQLVKADNEGKICNNNFVPSSRLDLLQKAHLIEDKN